MFIGIVFEIRDMLPSAENCAGAKGFKISSTSLVDEGLDKLYCTSRKSGRKYDR